MARKSALLIIAAIYFLTPYSIKNINVICQCGCRELICYCCGNPEHYGDVASFSECECDTIEEYYSQAPSIFEYFSEMIFSLDQIGNTVYYNGGSTFPGYKEPPMKPPPIS